jgi:hypothetical protein
LKPERIILDPKPTKQKQANRQINKSHKHPHHGGFTNGFIRNGRIGHLGHRIKAR